MPYHHYIAFDFGALLEALNQCRTSDPKYLSKQIPESLAIHDSLMDEPSFILHEDRQQLTRLLKQFNKFLAVL